MFIHICKGINQQREILKMPPKKWNCLDYSQHIKYIYFDTPRPKLHTYNLTDGRKAIIKKYKGKYIVLYQSEIPSLFYAEGSNLVYYADKDEFFNDRTALFLKP